MAESRIGSQIKLNVWNEVLTENRMQMTTSTTKVMRRKEKIQVRLEEELTGQVNNRHYLEIRLEERGQQTELNNTIEKANRTSCSMSRGVGY